MHLFKLVLLRSLIPTCDKYQGFIRRQLCVQSSLAEETFHYDHHLIISTNLAPLLLLLRSSKYFTMYYGWYQHLESC